LTETLRSSIRIYTAVTTDHSLPLCQYCDRPFFRSHGQQKFCKRNGLACQKAWDNSRNEAYRRLKRFDAQVGGGRGATKRLTIDQDWRCAACMRLFPTSPSERIPHALFKVWKAPGDIPCLVCPDCSKALHALRRTGLPAATLFAAAKLLTREPVIPADTDEAAPVLIDDAPN
jgi:hypothetical protein